MDISVCHLEWQGTQQCVSHQALPHPCNSTAKVYCDEAVPCEIAALPNSLIITAVKCNVNCKKRAWLLGKVRSWFLLSFYNWVSEVYEALHYFYKVTPSVTFYREVKTHHLHCMRPEFCLLPFCKQWTPVDGVKYGWQEACYWLASAVALVILLWVPQMGLGHSV